MKMQKQKEVSEKLAKLKEQPAKPQKQEKQEKQEVVPPDDEDDVLYCDTDDDDSLPDPFESQSAKKVETSDTKEDQAEDKATGTSEVMDTTDMPELISDEEEDEPTKQFTFKKLTGSRSHHK